MKRIASLTLALSLVLAAGLTATAEARNGNHKRQVNKPWEQAADDNNNGRVGNKEAKDFAHDHPKWTEHKSQVNKPWEHVADDNKDGVVDKQEFKDQRQDYNKAKYVNKDWEQKADTDQNGVVSKTELDAWGESNNNPNRLVNKNWEKTADRDHNGVVSEAEAKYYNSTLPTLEGAGSDSTTN